MPRKAIPSVVGADHRWRGGCAPRCEESAIASGRYLEVMAAQITLVQGDITEQHVDAVVNAANSSLLGGGGVDGAIHRRGGPAILAQCRELRRTSHRDGPPPGEAVATTAGDLPARWVIHTVGPVYGKGSVEQLRSCYRASLQVAADL